ncbi:hypothetical protein OG239_41435 [Streptomyces sp. NBC_00868]|uniref:hypothetical protein n=1 Tax=unclassified Streptomyces TaxID=2593676 RepID=UPI0032439FFC|nr:hypothetical protein OG239_41435 [Streptomyces sp. NBC_00868]
MAAQQAEATQGSAAPSTTAFLLAAKIKPGQADALREAAAANANNIEDPNGSLAQVGTVHFWRIAILNDDTFLFASHFDGDIEPYLDDFYTVTLGGLGFDAVLRYCEGWPGPNDREGFIEFWKSHRVPDLLTYAYYPGVTCKEIEKALRIRTNMEAVLEDFQ